MNEQLVHQITDSLQNEYIAKEAKLQEKADKIENEKKNYKKIIDSKVFEIEQRLTKDLHVELDQLS